MIPIFLVFSIDHTYKVYIGGAQKRPDGNYSRPVLDPNGQVIGQVGEGNRKDIRDAVEAAHKAAPGCVFVHFSFSVIKTLTISHQHQYPHSLQSSLFFLVLTRRICLTSKLLRLAIIYFIHMILMNNSGEIRCWSLLGFKGKEKYRNIRNIFLIEVVCYILLT